MKLQSKHTFPFFPGCDPDSEERQASCGTDGLGAGSGGASNGTPGTNIQFKANEFTQTTRKHNMNNEHDNRMRFKLSFAICYLNERVEASRYQDQKTGSIDSVRIFIENYQTCFEQTLVDLMIIFPIYNFSLR